MTPLGLLAACAVGPNYHRPSAPVPQAFKEADGWKPAEPRAARAQPLVVGVLRIRCSMSWSARSMSPNQTLKASEACVARSARAGE